MVCRTSPPPGAGGDRPRLLGPAAVRHAGGRHGDAGGWQPDRRLAARGLFPGPLGLLCADSRGTLCWHTMCVPAHALLPRQLPDCKCVVPPASSKHLHQGPGRTHPPAAHTSHPRQYYEAGGTSTGDYPVTDLIQMIGRASRPGLDDVGKVRRRRAQRARPRSRALSRTSCPWPLGKRFRTGWGRSGRGPRLSLHSALARPWPYRPGPLHTSPAGAADVPPRSTTKRSCWSRPPPRGRGRAAGPRPPPPPPAPPPAGRRAGRSLSTHQPPALPPLAPAHPVLYTRHPPLHLVRRCC